MAVIPDVMRLESQPRFARVAELADRQHGVVSIRQLEQLFGYSQRAVSHAGAAGRLHRVHPGVYAVGRADLSLQGECLAAVLACGPGALLSHYSAAWLWRLTRNTQPVPVHVTSPVPRRNGQPIRLHRSRTLADEDRRLEAGIPVTSVPRTLLDLAALVDSDWLQRILERSEELRLFDLHPVESVIERNEGHRGSGRLRRAIASYKPPAFTRSDAETALLAVIRRAGLPRPATGYNAEGHELDFYWPDLRFAVELDLFETHGTREAFERDRQRDEDLALAGIQTIRVTGRRLEREPRQLAERLSELLALRRASMP